MAENMELRDLNYEQMLTYILMSVIYHVYCTYIIDCEEAIKKDMIKTTKK